MFQKFDVTSSPHTGPARLLALRDEISQAGLDGYIVPHADRFQGEYTAPCDDRLAWLTGFTGSAGLCAVLPDVAGVFIDGRYRVQVRSQIADVFSPVHWPEISLAQWLKDQMPKGGALGFDPWLYTVAQVRDLKNALNGSDIELRPLHNLIDVIWYDRPAPPQGAVRVQPDDLAGESHASKRARLAAGLGGNTHAFIALPDSICWLLNIRGSDIPRNPVMQGYALLDARGNVDVFSDASFAGDVLDHLGGEVTLHALADLAGYIATLTTAALQFDPASTPQAVHNLLAERRGITLNEAQDPCILPKACKNPVEIAGSRDAHLRDGVAMVRFLAWLDQEAPKGELSEIDVVTRLEGFRRETNELQDISFETISGAGPHGAIVHYRVDGNTNRMVNTGELLLVDSGGQYVDGTTDITRTMAIGDVGQDEKSCYTRVLQGMIAISRVRFPAGVRGSDLDALARYPLWLAGQDYDHGTGHGVGSYLSVHEGPQGLSRRASTVLKPGMILSNEPGYYREGAFGIRIENLITVRGAAPIAGGDARDMLEFETLTFVPFDRALIDVSLLSNDEAAWIDGYHQDTLSKIGPRVDGDALTWLTSACAPLA